MTSTPRKLIVGLLDDRPFEEWWADHEAELADAPIQPLTAEQHARLVSLGLDVGRAAEQRSLRSEPQAGSPLNAPTAEPEFDMVAWVGGQMLLSITHAEAAHRIASGAGQLAVEDGVQFYLPPTGDRMRVV